MAFGQPAPGGDKLDYEKVGPALLLFAVHSFEENIMTSFGTSDALKVSVAVLSGPSAGEVLEDCLIFPKLLVSSLKKYASQGHPDNLALGTLGKGQAKQGQSAPWMLNQYTPQDEAIANQFLNASPNFGKVTVGQPQQAASQQSSGWGQSGPAGGAASSGWGTPAGGAWGGEPANPYPGHNILPDKRAEFISHGITTEHLNAVKHIPGYEKVPAATLKAKAEELMRPEQSAWGEPPF